jgi:hypothetical protein
LEGANGVDQTRTVLCVADCPSDDAAGSIACPRAAAFQGRLDQADEAPEVGLPEPDLPMIG